MISLAANQGLAEAQFELATRYESGDGVAKDTNLSDLWLVRAAKSGSVEAQYKKGMSLYKIYREAYVKWKRAGSTNNFSEIARKASQEAADLFRLAANQDHPEAQAMLGIMYDSYVIPVSENSHTAALKWYKKAAEQENILALKRLYRLYSWDIKEIPRI